MRRNDSLVPLFRGLTGRVAVLLAVLGGGLPGCGNSKIGSGHGGNDAGQSDPFAGLTSIEVQPPVLSLVVTPGTPVVGDFTAIGHYTDGHTAELTGQLTWDVRDHSLGAIESGRYTSATTRGGTTTVIASGGGVAGTAQLSLKFQASLVSGDDGSTAPADSAASFAAATEDAQLAPQVVYPPDGALVPVNLGTMELQWRPTMPSDLYEVSLQGASLDLVIYTNATFGAGSRLLLKDDIWGLVAQSAAGDSVTLTVRARSASDPTQAGTSAPVKLLIGRDDVQGGIYYWSAAGGTEGVLRHSFGDVKSQAEPFYTQADGYGTPDGENHCVACHALSRDGTKMAVTFDGGGEVSSIIDVATRRPIVSVDKNLHWNFASFNPDGTRMVGAMQDPTQGELAILDAATGDIVDHVDTAGVQATHPDWSPDGQSIVYATLTDGSDWDLSGGTIAVATHDAGDHFTFARTLDDGSGGSAYYPSFSPDGKWVVYNRTASGGSYDNPGASLWVVAADGMSPPMHLGAADGVGPLTNSWPRWSPFVQPNGPQGDLLYFTFSSKRAYGLELGGGQPQVWMAAFSPNGSGEAPGDPVVYAPFWLPFQDLATSNHIAQWTSQIIMIQ